MPASILLKRMAKSWLPILASVAVLIALYRVHGAGQGSGRAETTAEKVNGASAKNPQISAWVAPSLVRVGKTDAPGATTSIHLFGARGEYVATQIIVSAIGMDLTDVTVRVADLTGPEGAVIPQSSFSLYREHYVSFDKGSLDYGAWATNRPLPPGTYPDPLIPFKDPETGAPLAGNGASLQAVPFTLPAGENQPIWVDVFIPRGSANSPPGKYTGNIKVASSQGSVKVPVTLTVWNFELPVAPSQKTLFMIFHQPRNHSPHFQRVLLQHKLSPWLSEPADAISNVSELGMNRTGLEYYGEAKCDGSMNPPPSVADLQANAAQYPLDLPLDLYPADEVSGCTALYPTIKQWARNAHAAGARIQITMAPDPALYDDGSGTGKPAIDIWTLLPRQWPANRAGIPGELWSYNALEGDGYSPKWQIDFLPINFRIQAGFLNQTQGATGLLYWAVDHWPNEVTAWEDVLVGPISEAYWPGEGILVYPGWKVGTAAPAPSMRLKYLRDGIEDYEYVQLLKSAGEGEFASSVIQPIARDWHNWTQDQSELEAARIQLGEKLHSLSLP